MPVSAHQLNRATLDRQMLLHRQKVDVVEAVRRTTALQAQEPASPYIALWNRVRDFDPGDMDHAFVERSLLKAPLMRIALHAVTAVDYPSFQRAMLRTLRASRLNDRRFESTGLSIDEADQLVPPLIEFIAEPRDRGEIETRLAELLGREPDKHVFWALRTFAPLVHAPTGGPWSFRVGSPSYQAAPHDVEGDAAEVSLQQLIERYLEGFGPASAADFAQFAMQRQTEIRPALAAMSDRLVTIEGPDGAKLLDVPHGMVPEGNTPAPPRLLPMWDGTLLAYRDRGRVIPEEYRKLIIRRNGDVLPTLLVDGFVAGVWRAVEQGIEASAFRRLRDDEWEGLANEAAGLATMLRKRESTVYSRYRNWWKDMPYEERRLLPG